MVVVVVVVVFYVVVLGSLAHVVDGSIIPLSRTICNSTLGFHTAPQSPVTNRRQFLSAKTVRMSSVDLPDDNEKSLSSASTSPCPSPVSAQC